MKTRCVCLILLSVVVCCCFLPASAADDDGYLLDLPDEITVGLEETVTAFFHVPGQYVTSTSVYVVCDTDGSAMNGWTSTRETADTYADFDVSFKFSKKGDFVFHVQHGSWIRYITVHVDDLAVFVPDRPIYALQVGETVTVSFTKTSGALYSTCHLANYDYTGGIAVGADSMTVIGCKVGSYAISLNGGGKVLRTFTVIVVEPSENIHLEPQYDRACVGLNVALPVIDGSGKTVCALVEITEGAEYASLYYNTNNTTTICYLNPSAPGWITITAHGTDGSTDSVRMRIYEKPTSSNVNIPATTIAAGESMVIGIDYPEDSWYPVSMGLSSHSPASRGLTGPVATLQDGIFTALMPGTVQLSVGTVTATERYIINITDSDQALTIVRPEDSFYWKEPFQMSVRDKTGQIFPASFTATASHISVTADGLLTADGVGQGTVYVQLDNGLSYSFNVRSVNAPAWMQYNGDPVTIPLNESYILGSLDSDIGSLNSNDWVICSNDERIVQCGGPTIYPVSIGTTSVTVWSRYCDVNCEIPVTVTEISPRLYIDGSEVGTLEVPVDGTVSLPKVTDYYGNTVTVKWEVSYEVAGYGNPRTYCIKLNTSKKTVTGYWARGNAELTATSTSGATKGETIRVYVELYNRSTAASFQESAYTIHAGESAQVNFTADASTNGSRLAVSDVTFTVTGDTDSVYVKDAFFSYHTFVGLKPGTVTLTAKLWNGKKYTATVTVTDYEPCAGGHVPYWRVDYPASLTRNGALEQHCSRCGLVLGTEVIPCTGVLGFSQEDFFVAVGGSISLGTNVNGDPKYSFTWDSSDPAVATVQADRVTGLKAGNVTITVVTGDCEPAVCTVRVINATSLSVLNLPRNLKTIEDSAFEGTAATHAAIPGHVTSIGSRAFADCPNLVLVIIPESVHAIAADAFSGSAGVTISCPAGSYAESFAAEYGIPVAP